MAIALPGPTVKPRHALAISLILAEILFLVWYFKYLPMVDLPQHMFTVKVLTHYTDPVTGYDQFFTKRFPWSPYASYFWFAMLFDPLVGILNATRLYLSLTLVLTIVAFCMWQREAIPGREAQMIPATLLLTGLFFYSGLVNYLFSVPFMFFSFALSLRLGRAGKDSRSTEVWLALALLVTYFSHIVTFAITLAVIGVQQLVTCRGKGLWRLIGASLPSVAMMGIWMWLGLANDIHGKSWSYDPFIERLEYLLVPFSVFVDFLTNRWLYMPQTLVAWVVFVIAVLFARRQETRSKYGPALLVAALLVLSTLLFPSRIAMAAGALRLSYPTALAALLLVPVAWDEKVFSRWLVIAVCIATPLLLIPKIAVFQGEMTDLEEVIRAMPERQVIQPVVEEVHSAEIPMYPFLHSAAWYNYYKGGTNPYLFASVAHFPIKERRVFVPSPPPDMREFKYEGNHEGVDYFLVRTKRADIIDDLSRHVPLAARSGDWMAFGPNPKK